MTDEQRGRLRCNLAGADLNLVVGRAFYYGTPESVINTRDSIQRVVPSICKCPECKRALRRAVRAAQLLEELVGGEG